MQSITIIYWIKKKGGNSTHSIGQTHLGRTVSQVRGGEQRLQDIVGKHQPQDASAKQSDKPTITQIFCGDTAHVLPRSSKDLHGRDWLVRKHLSYVAQRLQASCREVAALGFAPKSQDISSFVPRDNSSG